MHCALLQQCGAQSGKHTAKASSDTVHTASEASSHWTLQLLDSGFYPVDRSLHWTLQLLDSGFYPVERSLHWMLQLLDSGFWMLTSCATEEPDFCCCCCWILSLRPK